MSLTASIGAAAGFLAAIAAVASLWRAGGRHTGPVRQAYRWFAVAAVLSFANLAVSQAVPLGGAGMMLSFADLPGLAVLPAIGAGLGGLASAGRAGAPLPFRYPRRGHTSPWAHAADACVVACGVFVVGWIALFAAVYTRSGESGATFAGELLHPLADLAFLGGTLAAVGAAGRRGVAPYLALAAVTAADFLAAGARVAGTRPGAAVLVAQLAGLGLLVLTSRDHNQWRETSKRFKGGTTAVAGAAALAAGLAVAVDAVVGARPPQPVALFAIGLTVVVLAVRVVSLVWRVNSWSQVWQESGRQFRQLADRTSDVVLLCGLDGVIRYAGAAVNGYGYTPQRLLGTPLADLLHPEDRDGGTLAVHRAVMSTADRVGRYSCRVRTVDGTWRHVESTISRYRDLGGPDQLLVTARDVSAQVELRQQVNHLKFHDALTGLPNRASLEQRAQEVLAGAVNGQQGQQAACRQVTGVIVVDVDGFTATNDTVGHTSGDLLLAQVARRLRLAVSPQDTVARWGGDEFAILVENADSLEEVADIGQRLERGVRAAAFRVGETDVSLTASVGVACADGSPAGHLWRNAEVAAASAKQAGGGRVVVSAAGAGGQPSGQGQPRAEPAEGEPPRSTLVS